MALISDNYFFQEGRSNRCTPPILRYLYFCKNT